MRKILTIAALILTATTADAGPLRNALSRLRVRVAIAVRGPSHCAAPEAVAPVKTVVAAVARAGGAIIPCPGGSCPSPGAK